MKYLRIFNEQTSFLNEDLESEMGGPKPGDVLGPNLNKMLNHIKSMKNGGTYVFGDLVFKITGGYWYDRGGTSYGERLPAPKDPSKLGNNGGVVLMVEPVGDITDEFFSNLKGSYLDIYLKGNDYVISQFFPSIKSKTSGPVKTSGRESSYEPLPKGVNTKLNLLCKEFKLNDDTKSMKKPNVNTDFY